MNVAELDTEGLVSLFKVLSKPDAFEVFLLAGEGIESSTYAIEELGITPKKYYARLRELVDIGFINKTEGTYRQTPFGSIICDRLLPVMGRAYNARDRLGLIAGLKGTQIEDDVRNLIEDELKIPNLAEPIKVKVIKDYESLVTDTIDMCDEARESIILASNYFDVRVMEATFRSIDRGVANRIIGGKSGLSPKLQRLKLIFSITLMKKVIELASMDMKKIVRFSDLPYSFCVIDGRLNLIIVSNTTNDNVIVAFIIDDKNIGEELTEAFEEFWEYSDSHPAFKFLDTLKLP